MCICCFFINIEKTWCYECSFFSSRRRHTRSYGDWSSDVCSSDLDCAGLSGFERAAKWLVLGTTSLISSTRRPMKSGESLDTPVTLLPGWERLLTRPACTGSPTPASTIGIVLVACLAATAALVPDTT